MWKKILEEALFLNAHYLWYEIHVLFNTDHRKDRKVNRYQSHSKTEIFVYIANINTRNEMLFAV